MPPLSFGPPDGRNCSSRDWHIRQSKRKWFDGRANIALELAREAVSVACGRTSAPGEALAAEFHLAWLLVALRHHDEARQRLAIAERLVAHDGAFDQGIILNFLRALSQGRRAGFSVVVEQAQAVLQSPSEAGRDWRSLAHVALAMDSLRHTDLRKSCEYARQFSADMVLGGLGRASGLAAWTVVQIEEARYGADAAAPLVERLISPGFTNQHLLLTEPAAAAWLARFMKPRDRGSAEAVAGAARKICARGGGLPSLEAAAHHAEGVVRCSVTDLRFASVRHTDAWAAASAYEDLGVTLTAQGAADQAVTALERALRGYLTVPSPRDAGRVKRRLYRLGRTYHHARWSEAPFEGVMGLTRTETAVAELVAQGLSNRQVADQLFMSRHTVAYHLRGIFGKLHISSRVELARTWAAIPDGENAVTES